MADAAVEFLLQKLSSLLQREASLLGGLYNEVNQIKCELESMKSFLKDSDGRNYTSESALTWVGQVRDVAYEIEDVVDEFVFRMERPNRGEAMGVFRNIVHFSTSLIARRVIASQLQIIKSKVHQISERRLRYGVRSIEEGTSSTDASKRWKRYEGPYSSTEDENIVGIGKRKDILVKWLMEDEPDRLVISVVGIGGSGKTTLVSRVYNTPIVKGHFDCFAWITVSQSYQVDDLLRRIMKEFFKVNKEVVPEGLDTMNYSQLAEMLNCYLQEKRYVIVLDDIWSSGVWSEMNDAFPDYKDGSRIIITSRNENTVPPSGTVSRVYHLQPLEENDAWSLFCKKAFWNDRDGACPREVLSWARNMVKKCEGLPLAIIAMGSLMSFREKTEVEWKKVYQNLSWELSNNPMLESVKGILLLSFRDLPYHLKHCFLYCSIFPEDFVIIQTRLIRLWIAEGFVCERRGMTLEEVADAYLQELIFRNMLQVAETNVVGGAEGCRMHDLLRELALSTSEKENFCSIYNDGKARRLSIHKSSGNNEYTTSI